MCGRYVVPGENAIEEYWATSFRCGGGRFLPRHNVAPTTQVPMVVRAPDGPRELRMARWGLIPDWWKKDKPPALSFNARAEEVEQKPMWKTAYRTRRCLMPAQGWYEWNENEPVVGASGRKTNQPYYISCPREKCVAFAGLWSLWEGAGAGEEPILSCALLSKAAAPSIAHIHPRMPVVLRPEDAGAWLDPVTPVSECIRLVAEARQDMEGYPVSSRVNHVREDDPALMEKVRITNRQLELL